MRRSLVLTLTAIMLTGTMVFGHGSSSATTAGGWAPLTEPIGALEIVDPTGDCSDMGTTGYNRCEVVRITGCPSLPPGTQYVEATIAVDGLDHPLQDINGMVSLFSGEEGVHWWGNGNLPGGGGDFISALRTARYKTAQVRWSTIPNEQAEDGFDNSWLESHSIVASEIGPQRMACRPATVIKEYLWDEIYKPMLDDGEITGTGCGFCLSGNSGGATQIAYSVVHYGLLDSPHNVVIGGLFPSSGPTHTRIDEGCTQQTGYAYEDLAQTWIDASYRWELGQTNGKCSAGQPDPTWVSVWNADSIENLGGDYSYLNTRFEMIIGGVALEVPIRNHACVYYGVVTAATKKFFTVPGMGHRVQDSADGLQVLYDAIVTGHTLTVNCPPPP